MARNAYRAITRIENLGKERAELRAKQLVRLIGYYAPKDPRHAENTGGPPLWKSYYVDVNEETGDSVVKCRRRYWVFVEYGTKDHGDAQPHVRPALRALKRIYK